MSDRFAATRFVLVEPSHPGNVGSAARAIKTMGFGRLVLVRPREPDVRAHPEARAMASGADDVLAAAEALDSLDAALAGVHWSLALSARCREFGPPVLAPRQAALVAAARAPEPGRSEIALVFGNERTGLANSDVERCAAIAHIDANPVYTSLNLAQAIQVLAYEMRLAYLERPTDAPAAGANQAAADDIERLFRHLEQGLIAIDFLDPAHPKKLMSRLRRLFARTGLESEEVHLLRGIAKQMLIAGSAASPRHMPH